MEHEDFYFEVEWDEPVHLISTINAAIDVLRPLGWCWRTNHEGKWLAGQCSKSEPLIELTDKDLLAIDAPPPDLYQVGISFFSRAGMSISIGFRRYEDALMADADPATTYLLTRRYMLSFPTDLGWTPSLCTSHIVLRRTRELMEGLSAVAEAWKVKHLLGYPRPRHYDDEPMPIDYSLFYFGKSGIRSIKYLDENRLPTREELEAEEESNLTTAPWLNTIKNVSWQL